jgi:hypothetical protein
LKRRSKKKISSLPQEEQDAIASLILAEFADYAAWADRFASHRDELSRLAEDALAEHRKGRTRPVL